MKIHVNGVDLYYEVSGSGVPLILIHGNGEDHTIFDEAVVLLSQQFTCYALDSRGHGQSTPVDTLEYEEMATDVLAFADELGLDRPIYYGFSDGGIIGLIAASRRPRFFRRMIISGANTDPRGVKDSLYYLFKMIYFFKKDPKILMMLQQPHITKEQLNSIETPTLVLAGSKDVIKEPHTKAIAAEIKNSRIKILEGEGHGSYIVHKTKIAKIILKFCKKYCKEAR